LAFIKQSSATGGQIVNFKLVLMNHNYDNVNSVHDKRTLISYCFIV